MTHLFLTTEDLTPSAEDQALADSECPCLKPDDQYLLEVDAGSVSLVHKACGKQARGDYLDLVEMAPVPVTVTAVPYGGCDGAEWHGEYRCDCGISLAVTVPPRTVPGGRLPFTRNRRTLPQEAS